MDMKTFLAVAVAVIGLGPFGASAEEPVWRHGTALIEPLKYPPDFKAFDYVNVDAPKGGALKLSQMGTFDSFNPILDKGDLAAGTSLVFETLLKPSLDEISAEYGLIAEAISYPDDFSSVTFRLNPAARFADGQPVTPEDVIFSFDKAKELNPKYSIYYAHVTKAEKTGEGLVHFTFDEKNNRELPQIVGQLIILPKHWWTSNGPDGKPRDVGRTTLETVMGSGPYEVDAIQPGSTVRYKLRDDYWGKDLPVNRGANNFATISYTYFGDRAVEFESFRSGNTDYWQENEAKRWATAYDFPAAKDGRVKREELENAYRRAGVMVGFIPNTRRPIFQNPKLREALNYAFDFEELNRTVFFDQYQRIDSYFYGTEFVAPPEPGTGELAVAKSLAETVDPARLQFDFVNPKGGTPALFRDNLRKSVALMKEAGYVIKGNRMVEEKSGKPLSFEILLNGPTLERVALPFANTLKRIGIEVRVRTVDAAQYTNRLRSFDYDMIYSGWGQSLNPGNEQAEYWGSKAASREGSQNYAGIADPAIDAVVQKVIFAPDRAAQVAAVQLLDRLLLAGHYIVPGYTLRKERFAYWDKFERPASLPTYSSGFPDIWWAKP